MVITEQDQLDQVTRELEKCDVIGVDTEADSLHNYQEKLCLIQISVAEMHVIVDPLANMDLGGLLHCLENREIILHGADFDLRMLGRAGGFDAKKVYDTMLAARLTGRTKFSLAALVEEICDVTLTKASRKADWSKRPLTPQMYEYALNDTRYLLQIRRVLMSELEELGRTAWLAESCEKAIESAAVTRTKDPDQIWRIKGAGAFRGQAAAVLRELWFWRDSEAEKRDVPPFKIMRNDDLLAATQQFSQRQRVAFPYVRGERRARFLAAGESGMNLPESDWPQRRRGIRKRLTPEMEDDVEKLKVHRDMRGKELGLEPSVIASRANLEKVVIDGVSEGLLMDWQREVLGL